MAAPGCDYCVISGRFGSRIAATITDTLQTKNDEIASQDLCLALFRSSQFTMPVSHGPRLQLLPRRSSRAGPVGQLHKNNGSDSNKELDAGDPLAQAPASACLQHGPRLLLRPMINPKRYSKLSLKVSETSTTTSKTPTTFKASLSNFVRSCAQRCRAGTAYGEEVHIREYPERSGEPGETSGQLDHRFGPGYDKKRMAGKNVLRRYHRDVSGIIVKTAVIANAEAHHGVHVGGRQRREASSRSGWHQGELRSRAGRRQRHIQLHDSVNRSEEGVDHVGYPI